jgi:hypothetical protein
MTSLQKVSQDVAGLRVLKTIVVWVITLTLLALAAILIAQLSLQLLHITTHGDWSL